MNELERFLTQLREDLNAIELELSDNLPRKIGDGKQYVYGIILNAGSESAVLKLFFRNSSQITTVLQAGQALELQSIPLSQIQNVQAGKNPNVVAYLTTSSTMLGAPKISVVGAPSVQDVSFNGVAQPVDVEYINFTQGLTGVVQYFEGTITNNQWLFTFWNNQPNTGLIIAFNKITVLINVASLSGTSPSVNIQLYTPIATAVNGSNSYVSSQPPNTLVYSAYNTYWYLAALPNASTGSITTTGIYSLSTTTPLGGIGVYATVGGTSPSIEINATLIVSYV